MITVVFDENYKFEWRSERKKSGDANWGDFTTPVLWAKYGEKGKDGDGIQYIFAITEENSAPNNPTPTDWETNSEYQNNEAEEYIPSGWSDDPIEVDATNKYKAQYDGHCQIALSYTTSPIHTIEYYVELAKEIEENKYNVYALKDNEVIHYNGKELKII